MKFQFTIKELLFFTAAIALVSWVCVIVPVRVNTVWTTIERRPTGLEIAQRFLIFWPPVVTVCLMVAWALRRLMKPIQDDDMNDE
jgi:hypothetical protein